MKRLGLVVWMCGMAVGVWAQKYFPVNGVADERPGTFALTHATIYTDYQTKIEDATLVIRDGRVVATGTSVSIPDGAQIIDLKGKYIYPAFVDPYSSYGLPAVKASTGSRRNPQYDSKKEGPYGWNEAVRSEYDAVAEFTVNKDDAADLRKIGFGAVASHKRDGIHRGSSVFVNLGDGSDQDNVLRSRASAHFSFNKGSSGQMYPNSIMGMVALIRQSYLDAQWYARQGKSEQTNLSLEAFNNLKGLPQVFEANNNKLRVLLADQIGDEFGVQYIIKGNGDEYQRLDEIKKTNASLIIPVNFPDAYDVADPLEALHISYTDLKHWELAPVNPKFLSDAGIEFSFTISGLKDQADYIKNVRKAVDHGLSPDQALKAMSFTPAKQLNMQNEVGSLKNGMRSNFFVASGDLFGDESPEIYQTWVDGIKYEMKPLEKTDFSGTYVLTIGDSTYQMVIDPAQKAKIKINDSTKIDVDFKVKGNVVLLGFEPNGKSQQYRLSGWKTDKGLAGNGRDGDENWVNWEASLSEAENSEEKEVEKKKDKENEISYGDIIYPFTAYGWTQAPSQELMLFQNATVWTMDADSVLGNTDVLIESGKIKQIGQGLPTGNAKVIDATGMHLTPGIIDEHSHVGLSGVNESSHAIVAEVRMYDAVDSEDIDVYRQLSGGVTAAQLLHGSANPVGGQSALVKFRWGKAPLDLRIKGADGYIKFALGENVKQSNWGDANTIRFPQTRMGVEQVFVDGFTRAKEYDAIWRAYNALSSKAKAKTIAPHRDLQLETLAEIVNSRRFITSHSYVQSEINMLMKVAEQFDFRVNTFTHILEGYKLADIMVKHGVGGSTFSDWWAYKYEVKDAIPYNAALMTQAGVTVAINSDDAEMARRLNQEAAKSIKFGKMEEYEAMKMVTINPAKLLHLEDRMGSIKVGKDADLVLWTDHPLSVYAKSQMTLVDGIPYFDRDVDRKRQKEIQAERARIIEKMKGVKASGGKTQKYQPKERHVWDCEEFVIETND
jgi:imidazolonepropionase-like amidohydrolase